MSDHDHAFAEDEWPFSDPQNVAAVSCVHILQGHAILRVTHDEDDGSWQLLCGGPHATEDAKIVCLGCMVKREPELLRLANLPLGWCAERVSEKSEWQRAPNV